MPTTQLENPYASPVITSAAPEATDVKPRVWSGLFTFGGLVALLAGYLFSTFTILELFTGEQTLFLETGGSNFLSWLAYGAAVAFAAAGAVMLGSQRMEMTMIVVYIMIPLAAVVFAIGSPLRLAKQWAQPISIGYLVIGAFMFGFGVMKLTALYAVRGSDEAFFAFFANFLVMGGTAFVIGAIFKLLRMPQPED